MLKPVLLKTIKLIYLGVLQMSCETQLEERRDGLLQTQDATQERLPVHGNVEDDFAGHVDGCPGMLAEHKVLRNAKNILN